MWIEFIISAVIIVFAGIRLTTYADVLGDRFNIHKAWVGVVLLGLVTSLPEAITSLTSVISFRALDLAVGNILGSNNINPLIIVILDIVYRKGSVTSQAESTRSHVLSGAFAILLTMVVLGEIFLSPKMFSFRVGFLSFGNLLIAIIYLVGIKILSVPEEHIRQKKASKVKGADKISLPSLYLNIVVSALFVIAAAIWLASSAEKLAQATGLGRTFFGSIFLAFVTSLPEIVVSLSALRLGSINMAIGNIFGSNMLNIFIIFICGLFYPKGSILNFVSQTHIISAILSIVLILIAIIGINIKKKKTVFGLGWDSILMIAVFIVWSGLIYRLR